jgi:hypothetical protein
VQQMRDLTRKIDDASKDWSSAPPTTTQEATLEHLFCDQKKKEIKMKNK